VKIDSISIYRVVMPLVYPFRTAFSDEENIESLFVKMTSGEREGWGESCPWRTPAYSSEWAASAFLTMREWLAPLLVDQDITSGDQLQQMLSGIKGNYFAKAGLDLAWWDLYAQSQGQPLWQAIGGTSDTIDVGADLGVMENLKALLKEMDKVVKAGFKRFKLKYRPGWEIDMVAAVRAEYPNIVMHVDCNSAYTLDDLDMFRELDRYNLAMIEQPLAHDDLVDHATLQQNLRTPVCLDESIVSPVKARQAIQLEACQWVNIKLGRTGGLTNALAIHNLCQRAGVPCWVGGMLESAVGQSHNIALATLPNIRYPSDVFPTSRFYEQDLGEPPILLSGPSQIQASNKPGIGCRPHPERLEKQLVSRAIIK
jgi:O-succinylbenzoate synthase